jgi:hypothetical protein
MAKKISQLTAAGALSGTELVEVVQGGDSKRTTAAAIAALAGSGSAAGSTGQIQFNNGGAFAGDSNFTYDPTTGTFTLQSPTYGSSERQLLLYPDGVAGSGDPGIRFERPDWGVTLELLDDGSPKMNFAGAAALLVDGVAVSLSTHNHSGVYQPADTQLSDLAGLSYSGNASKYIRVKGTEDGFELATITAAPAGADKQVQYNDGGVAGAEAGFEYDKTTNTLSVPTATMATAASAPAVTASVSLTVGSSGNAATINLKRASDGVTFAQIISSGSELHIKNGATSEPIYIYCNNGVSDVQAAKFTTLGVNAGTSFPGSPFTGMRWFRTDLGLECYYDGTRWLTVQQFDMPMPITDATLSIGTSGTVSNRSPVRQDYGIYLVRWVCVTFVSTTNTGAAYWTVALNRRTAANAGTDIASFTTGTTPDTASNWVNHDQTINAVLDSSARELRITVTKTGSPGGIYPLSTLVYRLIVT